MKMKNTIKFLFTIILLLAISNVKAQSHDMSPGSTCKLIKTKVNSESHICPACAAKDKKEKEAKVAENKRRDDAIVAKAKAENDARQAAWKAKQLEDAKNAHSGEVYINGNTINTNNANSIKTTKGTTKIISKKDNSTSKLFTIQKNLGLANTVSYILNESNDTISKSNEIFARGWEEGIEKDDIPTNVIIVQYVSQSIYDGKYTSTDYKYFNLINSNGEELLREKNINFLKYCSNGFFIYTYYDDSYPMSQRENDKRWRDDYKGCGSKMVLFDMKLNKKFYFEPNNEYGENYFYCVDNINFSPKTDTDLFRFRHFVKTENFGGDYENYIVNSNRQFVKISRTDR